MQLELLAIIGDTSITCGSKDNLISLNKAYPIINSVENSLRTLILKLMLVSVGINWSDKNIPL